jgi:acyl-CoA hydrolase
MLDRRMSSVTQKFPVMTADEAVKDVFDGATVAFSGFTPAGAAKAVPKALAALAKSAHERGEPMSFRVLTGASTGPAIDDALAEAEAVSWRAPYQSSKPMRDRINSQKAQFVDMHLSHVPQMVEFGFFGQIDYAVVEATDVTSDGRVYLTTSVGVTPSFLRHAKKVIIELNRWHSRRLSEIHDIAILPPPPHRNPIGINSPLAKIGVPFASVDPSKIVAVVETNEPDGTSPFVPPDAVSERIAEHVVEFLFSEKRAGRIPPEFLPLQAGVGNVANAVIGRLGADPTVPPFYMYTEVFQDSLVELMAKERLLGASSCSLTLTDGALQRIYDNIDFFSRRLVLRPQELSNNPGIIRRLGVIALNTAVEVDIYGMGNSTHVCGTKVINGLGGSGDFLRNGYLSLLICPSIAKGGKISTIVPMVTPRRSQRAFGGDRLHRAGASRSARSWSHGARPHADRQMRSSGLPRLPEPLPAGGADGPFPP